jgi:hypothetical protein
VVGFAGVASRVGARVRGQEAAVSTTPVVDVALGSLLIVSMVAASRLMGLGPEWLQPVRLVVGAVALIVEFAAWTLGVGAVLQTLADRWRPVPPVPAMPGTVVVP